MKSAIHLLGRLAPIVAITCSGSLSQGETVSVGGHPTRGHARPPLHVNVTPAVSTSYGPAQIRHAYGVDQLAVTGANQKIALVTAYGNPNIQSDLNTFCGNFGINSTTVQVLGNNAAVTRDDSIGASATENRTAKGPG